MSSIPPLQNTEPKVFIIESLTMEDENKERFEGEFLFNYLKLLGKDPIYYYVRSIKELKLLAPIFRKTGYRYLHISCHGNDEALFTTFDEVKFQEFASIFNELGNRRVFISGCELGNNLFAEILFGKNGGMYSIAAPTEKVGFHQMLPFWSAFYYLMESVSGESMKIAAMRQALQYCSNLFNVNMAYFFRNTGKNGQVDMQKITPEPIFDPKILKQYEKKDK